MGFCTEFRGATDYETTVQAARESNRLLGEKQSRRRTKRKASTRSKRPKEPSGVRKPPRFRQANSSAPEQAFAQRPTGFAVYGFHTCQQVKQQACLLLFCNLFSFKQRKKLTVSPFQRDKPPALSADKEKTYPIGRQSSRFFLFPEKRTP